MLFVALGIIWGIPYLFIRIAVDELSPAVVVLGRTVIGALVLLPFAWRSGDLRAVLRRWPGLPVVLREEEQAWAFTHPANQYPPFYARQRRPETLVAPGGRWACGGIEARFLPTPGHTPGGQCILLEKEVPSPLCFTGDTLFRESVGRTDLPGGSFAALDASLRRLAETLAPETTILPGHGPSSTMAHECRANPYLQTDLGF